LMPPSCIASSSEGVEGMLLFIGCFLSMPL
jgi:hypothetical protein